MSIDAPIGIDCTSAATGEQASLQTFSSYYFERNILTPAAQFRFAAPGVDRDDRLRIRSGDLAEFYIRDASGNPIQIGAGFIDETDTNVTKGGVEYSVMGRDTAGQLVDNDAVDENNAIIFVKEITLLNIAQSYLKATRLRDSQVVDRGCPTKPLRQQTNVGETKANSLQRYAEYCNCLVWTLPTGEIVVGKPDMAQDPLGALALSYSTPEVNNLIEARVKRNVNQAIRRLAIQIQALSVVDPSSVTLSNQEPDVARTAKAGVGTSKFMTYSLGNGLDAVNTLDQVGSDIEGNNSIGRAYAKRHLAMENMKVLDIECVVAGHMNEQGLPYNVDQVYSVYIEDEDLKENMYVYRVTYELTKENGLTTKLSLCRLGTIVADVPQTKG